MAKSCAQCLARFEEDENVLYHVALEVAVCDNGSCSDAYDKEHQKQTDFVSDWKSRVHRQTVFEADGCILTETKSTPVKGGIVVSIKLVMPGGVSTDDLNDFLNQVSSLLLIKSSIVDPKVEARQKKLNKKK